LRLIPIYIAARQPWSTGAAVGAGLTEQSTFTRRHTGVANHITTLTGTAIAVLTAGHAAHAIDANQAIAALCVVLTSLTRKRLAVAQLPRGAIVVAQTIHTATVQAITDLPSRTLKPVASIAGADAGVGLTGEAIGALVVVAATHDAFLVQTNPTTPAVNILSATIHTDARLIALSTFAELPQITLVAVAALTHTAAVHAGSVHRTLRINATPFRTLVVDAGLILGAFIVNPTPGRALTFAVAILPLRASVVVAAARFTTALLGADLALRADLIHTAAVGALPPTADLVVRTSRVLQTSRHTTVVGAELRDGAIVGAATAFLAGGSLTNLTLRTAIIITAP
jgi:hypothetical protein